MAKLKLVAAPTFGAVVKIPLAGGDSADVRFTFKHKTRTQYEEFRIAKVQNAEDFGHNAESFMEFVEAWDLEEPFTPDNVKLFLDIYGGAFAAVFVAYGTELHNWKVKN